MNTTAADTVRRIAIKVAALAQNGLTYGADDFDLDRYRQLRGLAAELLAVISGRPDGELLLELGRDSGYATPKIEVRGVVFDDRERVLLMREKTDGLWSLPGGWADAGDTPSVSVTREILEETGYHSSVVKLVACWDRERQGYLPPLPVHIWKMFFLCQADGPDGRPRRPTSSRPWTSAGSTSPPCRRCPSAGCNHATSSGPWPTTATPPCPPSWTSRPARRERHRYVPLSHGHSPPAPGALAAAAARPSSAKHSAAGLSSSRQAHSRVVVSRSRCSWVVPIAPCS